MEEYKQITDNIQNAFEDALKLCVRDAATYEEAINNTFKLGYHDINDPRMFPEFWSHIKKELQRLIRKQALEQKINEPDEHRV